jgi:hypothetical protein
MNEDPLVPVFMPALVVLLVDDERKKGSPLTRDEVIAIRDRGVCMMLKRSMAIEMAAKRGYDDIDPESAWEEWQVVRANLSESQDHA